MARNGIDKTVWENTVSRLDYGKALDFLNVTVYSYTMTKREKLLARAMNNPRDLS